MITQINPLTFAKFIGSVFGSIFNALTLSKPSTIFSDILGTKPLSPWPADMLVLASRLHEGKGGLTSLQSHGPEKTPAHARLGEGSNLTQNSLHQLPDGAFHYTIYNIGVLESKWFFTSITSWASIISVKSFLNSNSYPLTVYWIEVIKLLSQ